MKLPDAEHAMAALTDQMRSRVTPQTALVEFLVFYVTCVALTWWYYYRRGAEAPC